MMLRNKSSLNICNKSSEKYNAKEKEVNAKMIFHKILDKVFPYLSLNNLLIASAVCNSWQHAANEEIKKRNDIHCLELPLTRDKDEDENIDCSNNINELIKWKYCDQLRSTPHTALIFYNSKRPSGLMQNLNDECYLYYKKHLHCEHGCAEAAVMDGLAVAINDIEIKGENNKVAGILIPKTSGFNIKIYRPGYMTWHGDNNVLSQLADEAINRLLAKEADNNCFIFIIYQSQFILEYSTIFISEFLNSLKKRCKPGSYSLWGGGVSDLVTRIDSHDRNLPTQSFIMRLSGPAFKSWSIVLELNLSSEVMEEKLINFKKSIKLKNSTCAIAIAPSNKNESFEQKIIKTQPFRKVFPNIVLMSFFHSEKYYQIGTNSEINSGEPIILQHQDSVVYLILTCE